MSVAALSTRTYAATTAWSTNGVTSFTNNCCVTAVAAVTQNGIAA